MQVIFKTKYDQDINYLVNRGERFRVIAAGIAAVAVPLLVGPYFVSELSIFLVYALAGLGLMVAVGFTGMVSFGHGAFLAIGAYTNAVLLGYGLPFFITLPLGALLAGIIGAVLGRAASKMHGFYMAIATLAFAIVVETAIGAWEPVTGGHIGMSVPAMSAFGYEIDAGLGQYYIILGIVAFCIWGVANLMRSPTGRAFVAVRDSETSARSLGLDISRTRIVAFFISAMLTGLAGGLLSHLVFYLSPESFGVNESLKVLLMIVVGGLGTITGALFGAVFISVLPTLISLLREVLPQAIANQAGLEQFMFGAIIAAFIIFEPEGLYGRWRKFRLFLETYPFYKRATFTRQKKYLKTERFK